MVIEEEEKDSNYTNYEDTLEKDDTYSDGYDVRDYEVDDDE